MSGSRVKGSGGTVVKKQKKKPVLKAIRSFTAIGELNRDH